MINVIVILRDFDRFIIIRYGKEFINLHLYLIYSNIFIPKNHLSLFFFYQ